MDSEEANFIYKKVGKGRLALKTVKTGGKAVSVTLQKAFRKVRNRYEMDQLASAALRDERRTKIRELFQLKNSKLSFISDIVNNILEEKNDLSYPMVERILPKNLVYSSYGEAIERLADYLDMLEKNDPDSYKNLWRDKKGKLYQKAKDGVIQIWSPKKGFIEKPYLVLGQEQISFQPEGSELLFSALAEEAFEKIGSKNFRPNIKNVFKVKTSEELEEKLDRIFNRLKRGESVNLSKDEYLALEYYIAIENYKIKLSANDPNRTIFDQSVVKGLRKAMKNPKTTQVALELFDLYNQKGKITTGLFKKVLSNHGFNTTSIPRNYITNDLILRTNNLPQLVNERLFVDRLAPNAVSVIKDASKEIATEFAIGTVLNGRNISSLFTLIGVVIAFLTKCFEKRTNKRIKVSVDENKRQIKKLADVAEKILEIKQEPPEQLLEYKQESLPIVKNPKKARPRKSALKRSLERTRRRLERNNTVVKNNKMDSDPLFDKFAAFQKQLRNKFTKKTFINRNFTNPQLNSYVHLRGIAQEVGFTSDEIESREFGGWLKRLLAKNNIKGNAADVIVDHVQRYNPVPTLDINIDPPVKDPLVKLYFDLFPNGYPHARLHDIPLALPPPNDVIPVLPRNFGADIPIPPPPPPPNFGAFHHDIPAPPPPPNFDRAGGGENANPEANFNMFGEEDDVLNAQRRRQRINLANRVVRNIPR